MLVTLANNYSPAKISTSFSLNKIIVLYFVFSYFFWFLSVLLLPFLLPNIAFNDQNTTFYFCSYFILICILDLGIIYLQATVVPVGDFY